MKKLLLSAIVLLIAFSSFANYGSRSALQLSLWNNASFAASIDHQGLTTMNRVGIFENLTPGMHHLKVVKMVPGSHGHQNTKVLYNGYVNIPASSKVIAVISGAYNINFSEIIPLASYGYNHDNYGNMGYPPHSGYGMSDADFENLKMTLSDISFDSSRLAVAKQALGSNKVYASQVYELMLMLTFESSRLELAKYAYPHTIDKNNYYIVNSAFTFDSSINELNRFLY